MTRPAFLYHGNNFRNLKTFPSSGGVTLIELMIVVAIVAIILTLALPTYSNYIIRTKIAEALSVSKAAKTAVASVCQDDLTKNPRVFAPISHDFDAM